MPNKELFQIISKETGTKQNCFNVWIITDTDCGNCINALFESFKNNKIEGLNNFGLYFQPYGNEF